MFGFRFREKGRITGILQIGDLWECVKNQLMNDSNFKEYSNNIEYTCSAEDLIASLEDRCFPMEDFVNLLKTINRENILDMVKINANETLIEDWIVTIPKLKNNTEYIVKILNDQGFKFVSDLFGVTESLMVGMGIKGIHVKELVLARALI